MFDSTLFIAELDGFFKETFPLFIRGITDSI